jgi:hypothetical protein
VLYPTIIWHKKPQSGLSKIATSVLQKVCLYISVLYTSSVQVFNSDTQLSTLQTVMTHRLINFAKVKKKNGDRIPCLFPCILIYYVLKLVFFLCPMCPGFYFPILKTHDGRRVHYYYYYYYYAVKRHLNKQELWLFLCLELTNCQWCVC